MIVHFWLIYAGLRALWRNVIVQPVDPGPGPDAEPDRRGLGVAVAEEEVAATRAEKGKGKSKGLTEKWSSIALPSFLALSMRN